MCSKKPYEPWPEDLIYEAPDRLLVIKFNSGEEFNLPAEYLRVESPSAEVMGHNGKKNIVYGRKFVGITNIEEVGNYAIRLIFDDLHSTSIAIFPYLLYTSISNLFFSPVSIKNSFSVEIWDLGILSSLIK